MGRKSLLIGLPVFLFLSSLALSGCWLTDSTQGDSQIIIIGTWTPKGPGLNVNNGGSQDASNPRIALRGNTPYVAWIEDDAAGVAQVYVKHWDGASWVADEEALTPGLNVNVDKAATGGLDIASDGTSIYVAWTESGTGAHVKKLDGTGWSELGTGASSLSQEVDSPQLSSSSGIAFLNGKVYVILTELDGGLRKARVKHFDSSSQSWLQDGLDISGSSTNGSTPALVRFGTLLYAAWVENGSLNVSTWDGSFWVEAGLPIPGAIDPMLAATSGLFSTLYIGWSESGTTHVADWDGAEWIEIPNGPNTSATANSSALRLADWSGDLITTFLTPTAPSAGLVRSSLFIPGDPIIPTPDTWVELENGINRLPGQTAISPAIASNSLTGPWIAWLEQDVSGIRQLFVDHWE